ncbi:30S ribosomal protein THX [Psychroserpens sp. NJDZ02]|nr:30S ribosomal protein THX [Psychroserpens sp. NJDZ02]QCE41774.1 30S ribosomal protein THX [Psychroserpens sp. NJDZ02]
MGKGDKKSRRGKINRGTFGVRRPRIKKQVRPETKISIDKKGTVKP